MNLVIRNIINNYPTELTSYWILLTLIISRNNNMYFCFYVIIEEGGCKSLIEIDNNT